jgi:hypothetical protein
VALIVSVSMGRKADSHLVERVLELLVLQGNLELLASRPHQQDFGYPSYSAAALQANMCYDSVLMHLRSSCWGIYRLGNSLYGCHIDRLVGENTIKTFCHVNGFDYRFNQIKSNASTPFF